MQNVHMLLGAICSRYARVRSYLIKKRIAYVERVPTAWTYMVTIKRRFGDPSLPVIITPEGEWIADSEVILDRLEASLPARSRSCRRIPCTRSSRRWRACGRASSGSRSTWPPAGSGARSHAWWYEELGEGMFIGLPKSVKNRLTAKVAGTIQAHLPRIGVTTETQPLIWRWARQNMDALDAHLAVHPYLLGERATHDRLRPDRAHVRPPRAGSLVARRVHSPAAASPRVDLADEPAVHDAGLRRRTPSSGRRCRRDCGRSSAACSTSSCPSSRARSPSCAGRSPQPPRGKRIERFLGTVSYPYAGSTHARQAMPFTLWLVQRSLDMLAAMPRRRPSASGNG